MAIDRRALEARLRERFAGALERRAKLVNKALRDPVRFLGDARSPLLRRLGDVVIELGVFPAVDDEGYAFRGPRHLPLGHRDPGMGRGEEVSHGALAPVIGNRLSGHALARAHPAELVVLVDDREVARLLAAQPRHDVPGERSAFDVCVDLTPPGVEAPAEVCVRVVCATSGRDLPGSPVQVRVPRYEGAITSCRRGLVRGHVRDVVTGAPVHLDVRVDERDVARFSVLGRRLPHPSFSRLFCAFSASYEPRRTDEQVVVRVRGTSHPLFGTPRPFDVRRPVAPSALPKLCATSDVVHVIVPVYADLPISMRCVESALRAVNDVESTLTVIYDAGPDPALLDALRARAADGSFELLVNETNLGFVRTCNRGMRLRPTCDVVLLNADTEVSDGWLDRLARAARASDDIGTATPFSNAATICTYPVLCEEGPLPEGTSVAEMSARFAAANAGESVDLPTGHGFCLFIRRTLLDAVGLFDEEAFGRGYGEENDLCLRGREAGFRDVLACDAFVMHVGSVSFAGERPARVRTALATIAERYPYYDDEIAAFTRRDPLAPYRNRVVVQALAERCARASGAILMVSHHLGGGVAIHVRGLTKALAREGFVVLELRSHDDGSIRLVATSEEDALEAVYPDAEAAEAAIVADLRTIGVRHVHYHQWLTLPGYALGLADALGVPFDVTLHDYFVACPRICFVRADGTYCGEPAAEACNTCIATDGPYEAARFCESVPCTDVPAWRAMHLAFLRRARVVLAPSHDTAARAVRALGPLQIRAQAHPEAQVTVRFRPAREDAPVHVAVLGGIGLHKGYVRLLELARYAARERLPLRFVIFGTTVDSGSLRRLPNVEVTGRYQHDALNGLVERSACTVAAFFSICPETYSYTLSEAIALGLHPVTFDLGAPAERIRAFGHGTVLDVASSADVVCRALIEAGRKRAPSEPVPGPFVEYPSIVRDYYGLPVPRLS